MNEQVAITGIGIITPQIMNLEELLQPLQNYHTKKLLLDRFDVEKYLGKRGHKYLSPATKYILAATKVALDDANIIDDFYKPGEKGVIVGTNFSVNTYVREKDRIVLEQGVNGIEPMEAPNFSINLPASYISMKHKFEAFNITLTSGIVSGLESLILGAQNIRNKKAKMVLVGATEGEAPAILSEFFNTPIAEGGSCVFILEDLKSAKKRNAKIYATIGKCSLCFLPVNNKGNNKINKSVMNDLSNILLEMPEEINYYETDCDYTAATIVREIVQDTLQFQKKSANKQIAYGYKNENISVSALIHCAHSIVNQLKNSLVISASPQGHIAIININT